MKTSTIMSPREKGGRHPLYFAMSAILLFSNAKPLLAEDIGLRKVDDAVISTQVKTALLYHLVFNFQVKTMEGFVTLSGTAVDLAEKERNTKLVLDIKGVRSVVNNMVVPVTVAGND